MRYATVSAGLVLFVFLFGAGATTASAQTVRVTAPEATVHLNPDTASPALTTVKAGTLLETAGPKGDFYVVVLPPDPSGLRRMGYIVMTAVERVGPAAAGAEGQPRAVLPSAARPTRAGFGRGGLELSGYFGTNRNLAGFNEAFASGLEAGGLDYVTWEDRLPRPWTAGMTVGAATGRWLVTFGEFAYTRAAHADFTGSSYQVLLRLAGRVVQDAR